MAFFDIIFSILWDISDWFYEAYLTTNDWVPPFNFIAPVFYRLSLYFWDMITPVAQMGDWASDLVDEIANFLSAEGILELLEDWLDWAAWSWEWIQDAADYVTGIVDTWWDSAQLIVQGWIDQAREYLEGLVAGVMVIVDNLQAAWDAFAGKIPTIDEVISWWGSWSANVLLVISDWWTGALDQVQALIDTGFIIREDLWAGWTDFRDQVIEFFTDPLEVLWSKFADWFLGPEV